MVQEQIHDSSSIADTLVFVVFVVAGTALLIKLLLPSANSGSASGAKADGDNSAADSGKDTAMEDDKNKDASVLDIWLQNNPVLTATATYFFALVTGFHVSALGGESAAETSVGGVVGFITNPGGRLQQIIFTLIELGLFVVFVFEFTPGDSINWPAIGLSLFAFVAGLLWRLRRARRLWKKVGDKRKEIQEDKNAYLVAKQRLVQSGQQGKLIEHLNFYVGKLEFLVRVKRLAPFLIEATFDELQKSLEEAQGYKEYIEKLPAFTNVGPKNLIDAPEKNQEASAAIDTALAVNHVYYNKPRWTNRVWGGE